MTTPDSIMQYEVWESRGSPCTSVHVQSSIYQSRLLEEQFEGGNAESVMLRKSATSLKLTFTTGEMEIIIITITHFPSSASQVGCKGKKIR